MYIHVSHVVMFSCHSTNWAVYFRIESEALSVPEKFAHFGDAYRHCTALPVLPFAAPHRQPVSAAPPRMSSISMWRTFCRIFYLARDKELCRMKHSLNWFACFPIRSPCFHRWVTMVGLFLNLGELQCWTYNLVCFHSLLGTPLSTCPSSRFYISGSHNREQKQINIEQKQLLFVSKCGFWFAKTWTPPECPYVTICSIHTRIYIHM